eukprot:3525963-Pyramimonas_sp.AAC.1
MRPSAGQKQTHSRAPPPPGCTGTPHKHEEHQGALPEATSTLYLGPTVSLALTSARREVGARPP